MLGLPPRGRPHEVAVDRASRPRRVEPRRAPATAATSPSVNAKRAASSRASCFSSARTAAREPRPAYTAQAPRARALPVRHVPEQAARPYRRRPRARRARPTRAAARPRRPVELVDRVHRHDGHRDAEPREQLQLGCGWSRPIGTRPAASAAATATPRRPMPAGPRTSTTVGRVAQLGGERRDGPGEPRRRCHGRTKGRRRARRRGTAGPPPSGGAVPRPPPPARGPRPRTSVPRSSSADGDGDPERLEHEPQQAGGRVAPRAVVVGAAEQRRELGIGLRPPGGGDQRAPRPASARGDRAGARAGRPPAAATRAAPRPPRRSRGRAPAGHRPRRRSSPPRRRSPDPPAQPTAPAAARGSTANAIRSTSRSSRSSEPSVTPRPRRTSRARRPCRRAARSRPAPPRRRPGS